jgi:hypothetical protein
MAAAFDVAMPWTLRTTKDQAGYRILEIEMEGITGEDEAAHKDHTPESIRL